MFLPDKMYPNIHKNSKPFKEDETIEVSRGFH